MGNRALGGKPPADTVGIGDSYGPYNVGLLVKTSGIVTYVSDADDFFYIDDTMRIGGQPLSDGSGQTGLRVSCAGLEKPVVDDYVMVTGISSIWLHDGVRSRCLLPWTQNDIVVCGHRVAEGGGSSQIPEEMFGTESIGNLVLDPLGSVDLQPGCIDWAVSLPDGTLVSLQGESVTAISDGGCSIALREWYEPDSETPRLVLQLPWSTALEPWNQIDIINGTLGTLPSGQRIITNPEAVYRRLGPNALPTILVPKGYQDDGQPELWPWPEAVYTR